MRIVSITSRLLVRLEGELRAEEEHALVAPVADVGEGAAATALEVRALVVEHQPDPAVQVPAPADAPGARALRLRERVGEAGREDVGIDAQLVVAGGDLEGAPGSLPEREARARQYALEGGVLPGQDVGGGDLPGLVVVLLVAAAEDHAR